MGKRKRCNSCSYKVWITIVNMRESVEFVKKWKNCPKTQKLPGFYSSPLEGTYAAILMDMNMPVMDGLRATAAIRALDRPDAKRIPIIALTANTFEEDKQHSLQAGMDAFLIKPVDADHLYQLLGELIYEAEI